MACRLSGSVQRKKTRPGGEVNPFPRLLRSFPSVHGPEQKGCRAHFGRLGTDGGGPVIDLPAGHDEDFVWQMISNCLLHGSQYIKDQVIARIE